MDKIGINTIQGCLATSRAAYLLYQQTGILGCNSVSAYLIQQTAEKLIKVQIPEREAIKLSDKEYQRFKTHNLKLLVKLFHKYNWPLIESHYFNKMDAQVTSWNTKGRYQEDFWVDGKILDDCHIELVYWFDHVKRFHHLPAPKTEIKGRVLENMNTFKEYMNVDTVLLESIYSNLVEESRGSKNEEDCGKPK